MQQLASLELDRWVAGYHASSARHGQMLQVSMYADITSPGQRVGVGEPLHGVLEKGVGRPRAAGCGDTEALCETSESRCRFLNLPLGWCSCVIIERRC